MTRNWYCWRKSCSGRTRWARAGCRGWALMEEEQRPAQHPGPAPSTQCPGPAPRPSAQAQHPGPAAIPAPRPSPRPAASPLWKASSLRLLSALPSSLHHPLSSPSPHHSCGSNKGRSVSLCGVSTRLIPLRQSRGGGVSASLTCLCFEISLSCSRPAASTPPAAPYHAAV